MSGRPSLSFLKDTVRLAGRLAMKYFGRLGPSEISTKSSAIDLVTRADRDVEAFVRARLGRRHPDVAFLGEEQGRTGDAEAERIFVLDPIDGTTNFVHSYPFFAVSLAYKEAGRTVYGLVYAPFFRDLYHAVAGHGAFKNSRPIRVSRTAKLIDSLAVTGFACIRSGLKPDNMLILNKAIYKVSGVRRDGSAAIDLCHVAEGKTELFWEMNLSPWDVAAGSLIVIEAGGRVTDFQGGSEFEPGRTILASNGLVHGEFLSIIQSSLVEPAV